MFRSVIASINTEDGEIIDSDDEEWTDEWVVEMREKTTLFEMTVYQHSEFFDMLKTACLELGIECDDGEGGENGDAGRKKYPLQVKHQHQQNHNLYPLPPPQSFQEFMDILHTPREQMDDSTWMQLVTDFVGGRVDQRRHHFHFLGRFMELFGCRLIPSHFTACVSIPGGGIDGATGGCIVGGGRGGGGRINDKEKAKEEVEVDGYHVWEAEDDEDWLPFSTDLGSGDEHKNTTTLAASSISDAATNTTTETPDYDYCSCCSKGDLVQEALMKAGLLERLRLTVRQHFINPDKTKMKEKKKHQHQLLSQEHEKVE